MTKRKPNKLTIPVIDLFAGPGGLCEGFSTFESGRHRPFSTRLSVEKDPVAHQTLTLRAFFRKFRPAPKNYYRFLRGEITLAELYQLHPAQAAAAAKETLCAELGGSSLPDHELDKRISSRLGDARRDWVLIGGPPCQAYSMAGRSRNRGKSDYKPEKDKRHFLYKEYLRILAVHQPSVFVMENVKGILSSEVQGENIFQQIILDLTNPSLAFEKRPGRAVPRGYRVHSLVVPTIFDDAGLPTNTPTDFVIESERFGIPQARHRVILLGIRDDIDVVPGKLEPARRRVSAGAVLEGLPKLRAGLSREPDGVDEWLERMADGIDEPWFDDLEKCGGAKLYDLMLNTLVDLEHPKHGRGAEFIEYAPKKTDATEWYIDPNLGGVCNSSTRRHIVEDLYRYLYAACFAAVHKKSPRLRDFPKGLHPDHENVSSALEGSGNFSDRFRVQLKDQPSTTVVSHISKDGHYYIHYDPTQCRSLTVREAARLQTFKDNYFFCGNRTQQYHQVGNAVPPRLAQRIAAIVYQVIQARNRARVTKGKRRKRARSIA